MKDNAFLLIAFLLFCFSLIGVGATYNDLRNFVITGKATDTGSVNVTVQTTVLVNFTTSSINWGSGSIIGGASFAYINSWGNVTNGNWTTVNSGLVIKNEGNVNITLNLSTANDADSFIGGTNPAYQFNVTNVDEDACTPPAGFNLGEAYDSSGETFVCETFVSNTSIRVDIALTIPSDSDTGTLSDTLTAVISEAA